jgi:hypothetical protein
VALEISYLSVVLRNITRVSDPDWLS